MGGVRGGVVPGPRSAPWGSQSAQACGASSDTCGLPVGMEGPGLGLRSLVKPPRGAHDLGGPGGRRGEQGPTRMEGSLGVTPGRVSDRKHVCRHPRRRNHGTVGFGEKKHLGSRVFI